MRCTLPTFARIASPRSSRQIPLETKAQRSSSATTPLRVYGADHWRWDSSTSSSADIPHDGGVCRVPVGDVRCCRGRSDRGTGRRKLPSTTIRASLPNAPRPMPSPVTRPMRRREAVIVPALRALTPDDSHSFRRKPLPPAISPRCTGRAIPATGLAGRSRLDGTKEFISRNGEFATVNIALIEDGRPLLGVVHVPGVGHHLWRIVPDIARRRRDGVMGAQSPRATAGRWRHRASSRSHGDAVAMDAFLRPSGSVDIARPAARSSARRGRHRRSHPRSAAPWNGTLPPGHAVVVAAGGRVTTLDGAELTYGKPDLGQSAFVARGRAA